MLVLGVAACALAFVLYRREDADAKTALVTLVVGVALLFGAFAIPRA